MLTRERIFTLLAATLILLLLAACSSDPDVLIEKATELAGEGELDKAMELFDKALEKDPNYVDAYYSRAIVWLDEGNHDRAAADLDKLLDREPEFKIDPSMAGA